MTFTMVNEVWNDAAQFRNEVEDRLACELRCGGRYGLRCFLAHKRLLHHEEEAMWILDAAVPASRFS